MNDMVRKFYREVDPTRIPNENMGFLKDILHMFEVAKDQKFLDIGCYDGSKTKIISSFIDANQTYGVDFLFDRLITSKVRGINVLIVDLNSEHLLPFVDEYFDAIFVGDVIEHLFSPDHLLSEIYRLLRPGGYAVITTPNLASWRNRIVLSLGWLPFSTEVSTSYRVGNPRAPSGKPSGHIRVFTSGALRELTSLYGFRTELLEGKMVGVKPVGLVYLTQLVDRFFARFRSTLCDELAIKLRKPS